MPLFKTLKAKVLIALFLYLLFILKGLIGLAIQLVSNFLSGSAIAGPKSCLSNKFKRFYNSKMQKKSRS